MIDNLGEWDYNENMRNIKFQCQFCHKEFISKKVCKSRIPKFCSRECYAKSLQGKKLTEKQLEALKKGRGWCKGLKGIGGWKWSEESKRKASKSKRGKKLSKEHRKALSKAKRGKPIKHFIEKKEDVRKKISSALLGKPQLWIRGKNHWNWQGGKTEKNFKIRNSLKMKEWKRKILKRDDYTCQVCRKRGGRLIVDHIKPFSKYPNLRFDMKNGRTICKECDLKSDTYGGRAVKN